MFSNYICEDLFTVHIMNSWHVFHMDNQSPDISGTWCIPPTLVGEDVTEGEVGEFSTKERIALSPFSTDSFPSELPIIVRGAFVEAITPPKLMQWWAYRCLLFFWGGVLVCRKHWQHDNSKLTLAQTFGHQSCQCAAPQILAHVQWLHAR